MDLQLMQSSEECYQRDIEMWNADRNVVVVVVVVVDSPKHTKLTTTSRLNMGIVDKIMIMSTTQQHLLAAFVRRINTGKDKQNKTTEMECRTAKSARDVEPTMLGGEPRQDQDEQSNLVGRNFINFHSLAVTFPINSSQLFSFCLQID